MLKYRDPEKKGASMKSENKKLEKATFAGGCFWCMEPPFEKLNGVVEVIAGYTGGEKGNPYIQRGLFRSHWTL